MAPRGRIAATHAVTDGNAGYATTTLLEELEREESRKGALATELTQLADPERVVSLDGTQVSRMLTMLAADVHEVFAGTPGPDPADASQALRRPPHRVPALRQARWNARLPLSGRRAAPGVRDRTAGGY
jgi:hypothetical protein